VSVSQFVARLILLLLLGYAVQAAAETRPVQWLHLETAVPAHWQEQAPGSSMRLAQYLIPGETDAAQGMFIVYYFGRGQGGSAAANIARWQSQFSTPEGAPVEPAVDAFETGGLMITRARLDGSYARGIGMGPQGAALPNQTLIAAVVESGDQRIILQLYGPTETIERETDGFDQLIHGFRVRLPHRGI